MEVTSVVVLVLAVCIGIPGVIALAVAGVYRVSDRRARRAERVKVLEGTVAEALPEQPAEAGGEAVVKESTKEPVQVVYTGDGIASVTDAATAPNVVSNRQQSYGAR